MSNFSNPLGSCPDNTQKQALLSLLNRFNVPLVEDDIYGDLAFNGRRPAPYKQFDSTGEVLYCNSFSKTISPGLRVGWLAAGRYTEKAAYLKFTQNIASPSLNQQGAERIPIGGRSRQASSKAPRRLRRQRQALHRCHSC